MSLRCETLPGLMGKGKLDWLGLTSFSLEERELFSSLYALGINPDRTVVRFDPAAFRGAERRIVEPTILRPVALGMKGAAKKNLAPPIFHPKVALARREKNWTIIVGTANLSRRDQREDVNLHTAVPLTPDKGQKVKRWLTAPTPQRSLCLVQEQDSVSISISNEPIWTTFTEYCPLSSCGGADWILAAPFWSSNAMDRIPIDIAKSVTAYFRTASQAHCTAGRLRDRPINCFVPYQPGFHYKLLAVRRLGPEPNVVAYLGSANMTASGMFGISVGGKKRARNWEAGIITIGGRRLWKSVQAAATCGSSKWPRQPRTRIPR